MPEYDIMVVKRVAFRDMGTKLKSWKHQLKHELNIQPNDTLATMMARVEEKMLYVYNPMDLDILLKKCCGEENQIGHKLYLFFVYFNLIVIMLGHTC